MQISSSMALFNYKVPIIMKKNSNFVLANHGKTTKYFSRLSRTYQPKSKTFKDFPGQQKKSRTFPGCGNPVLYSYPSKDLHGLIYLSIYLLAFLSFIQNLGH